MKNLLDKLRTTGANNLTINTILILFTSFLFLLGIACVVVLLVDALRNIPFQPVIISVLSILITASAGLITVSHTTTQINGTAAQSAQAASNVSSRNAIDMQTMIQQVVGATLAGQKQADTHSLEMQVQKDTPTKQ